MLRISLLDSKKKPSIVLIPYLFQKLKFQVIQFQAHEFSKVCRVKKEKVFVMKNLYLIYADFALGFWEITLYCGHFHIYFRIKMSSALQFQAHQFP